MPIIKSAKKAARQAKKRRAKNILIKNDIKAALRDFKARPTAEKLQKLQSEYDKAVKKKLLKKNTASRRKATAAKFAKENGVKITAAKKETTAKKAPAAKTNAVKKPTAKKTTK